MAQADDNQTTSLGPVEASNGENIGLGEVLREFRRFGVVTVGVPFRRVELYKLGGDFWANFKAVGSTDVLSDVFETGQQRLSVLADCLQKLGHKHGLLPMKSSSESQQVTTSEFCRSVDRTMRASSPLQQESNELTKLGDDVMEIDIFNECSAALEQEPNPDDVRLKGRMQLPPPGYVPQEFSSVSTERTSMTYPSLDANVTCENRPNIKRYDDNACLCCLLPVDIFEHAFSMPCCTGNAHLSCVIRTIGAFNGGTFRALLSPDWAHKHIGYSFLCVKQRCDALPRDAQGASNLSVPI
ncbi:hypothetical protein NDN08_000195 [Rhodosorus marinus]|uniref:Uncharacterized protein n=1 Tax=Rhodosorus marinus TaxID=101924 RepID=A0AAV8UJQ2_9RHOD|nr:hypothetical protein NDN08_000195 [Rhodosorus marinus]